MSNYSNNDKRAIVYYTSVAEPNLRHKVIAKKLNRTDKAITLKISKMRASGEYDQLLNVIMQEGWAPKSVRKSVPKREEVQLELPLDEPAVPAKIYWQATPTEPEIEPESFSANAAVGVIVVAAMALSALVGVALTIVVRTYF
jgi:hypothetical protein